MANFSSKEATRRTFILLGGLLLLVLLARAASPLHPLPAAEHVVVLVRGHFLRILVLRENSCREEAGLRVTLDTGGGSGGGVVPSLRLRRLAVEERRGTAR